jgi:hypothetical protein
MVLTGELHAQRHHNACDVASAEDGVSACQRQQLGDRGGLLRGRLANGTMHRVMHIGRVPHESGGFGAHMAVLVKPNGLLGHAYMAAIRPFRHLIVYPPMMRDAERAWVRSDRTSLPRTRGSH